MVVDVYAKWAGPCSLMRPVILKVKAKVRHREVLNLPGETGILNARIVFTRAPNKGSQRFHREGFHI